MTRRRFPHLGWLLLSLAIMAAAAVPAAYVLKPGVERWYGLRDLNSPDIQRRERALSFLIARGREDPEVVRAAGARLKSADDANFIQIVNALEGVGGWRRPVVTDGAWLRWLEMLAGDHDARSRVMAAQQVGELTDLAGTERVRVLLGRLIDDRDGDVRYNALIAAVGLAATGTGRPRDSIRLMDIVRRGAGDRIEAIARQGWIFLGLLGAAKLNVPKADWRQAPAAVAEAMMWAMAQGERADVRPAIEALNDTTVDPDVRAMAAYVLHTGARGGKEEKAAGAKALADWLKAGRERVTMRTLRIYWRAILGVGEISNFEFRISNLEEGRAEHGLDLPLRLALAYRLGVKTQAEVAPLLAGDELLAAATLDGTRPDQWVIPVGCGMPDVLRLLALTATRDPRPEDLYPLLGSDVPAIRDEACLLAADRFSAQQNDQLIAKSLKDFNDRVKMSGAILAGLTGRQGELLARVAADEEVWSVAQIMKLGMWMQEGDGVAEAEAEKGTGPFFVEKGPAPFFDGLLTRGDLPRTTVLMALMQRKEGMAFDDLFNPRGEAWPGLDALLSYQHWWVVVRRYLPAEGPDFWPWGDEGLRRFQLEVMRDWLVVHPAGTWSRRDGR